MSEQDRSEGHDAREKILEIASRLFSQQGYENTSLSQVARAAKVSKALIFWHFDTKDKLYELALDRTLQPFIITADTLRGPDERQQLESLVDQFYDFVRDHLYSVRFFMGLVLREEKHPGDAVQRISELYAVFRGLFADVIARGHRQGVFRSRAPQLDASLIMATLAGLLVQQFLANGSPRDQTALLDHFKTSVLDRLGVPASGRARR
jgi:AcrR family transcriptional regulator